MRRLSLWVLSNVSCWIVIVIGITVIARTQPPPTRMENFRLDKCALPCWSGIVVGKTTVGEGKRLLRVNFPRPQFRFGDTDAIRDRLTSDWLRYWFNNRDDPATQLDTATITRLEVFLGTEYPLTAGELFSLVGEPEFIGVVHESYGLQPYALYCTLGLRAVPLKNIFELASPDDDMGGLVIIYPPEDACDAVAGVKWDGFTGNYHQQLQDEFNP